MVVQVFKKIDGVTRDAKHIRCSRQVASLNAYLNPPIFLSNYYK